MPVDVPVDKGISAPVWLRAGCYRSELIADVEKAPVMVCRAAMASGRAAQQLIPSGRCGLRGFSSITRPISSR